MCANVLMNSWNVCQRINVALRCWIRLQTQNSWNVCQRINVVELGYKHKIVEMCANVYECSIEMLN